MNNEYGKLVKALAKDSDEIMDSLNSYDCHLIHMIMGVCGEAGQLLDGIKKGVIHREQLDMKKVVKELGNIEFYLEGLRQGLDLDRDVVIQHSIDKLNAQHVDNKS